MESEKQLLDFPGSFSLSMSLLTSRGDTIPEKN